MLRQIEVYYIAISNILFFSIKILKHAYTYINLVLASTGGKNGCGIEE
jgi:hypothetical protein